MTQFSARVKPSDSSPSEASDLGDPTLAFFAPDLTDAATTRPFAKPAGTGSLDGGASSDAAGAFTVELQRATARIGDAAPTGALTAPIEPAPATGGLSAPPIAKTPAAAARTGPMTRSAAPAAGVSGTLERSAPPPRDVTAAMARQSRPALDPAAEATAPIAAGTAPMPGQAVTAPMARQSTQSLANGPAASTRPAGEPAARTAPMRPGTGTLRAAAAAGAPSLLSPAMPTAPLASAPAASHGTGGTGPLAGDPEVVPLQAALARDPEDADALFKLSVLYHRSGHNDEARATLTKLAQVYEKRGQLSHAARIMRMLGAPSAAPISTEELPPRPKRTSVLRHTDTLRKVGTDGLRPLGTGALRQTGLLGKSVRDAAPAPSIAAFPPESLTFTIPLPGEEELPAEVRAAIDDSTADLRAGRLQAAFDACVHALALDPAYPPLYLRIAEIYTAQRLIRRARSQAETLVRLLNVSERTDQLWMVQRVLLHTSDNDLPTLKRLVELLIEAEQPEQASFYASKLIQLLDREGLADDALAYSVRLCELIPADTRAALENAILRLKAGDVDGAVERWEAAVQLGADAIIARASLAAAVSGGDEGEHWRMLAEVVRALRERKDPTAVAAYVRTAEVMAPSPLLKAGHGLLLAAMGDPAARPILTASAGDRTAPPLARAASAVTLAGLLRETGPADEHVAAIRTALKFLQDDAVANHPAWLGLVGIVPRFEDLSLELGEALLARQDAAGAAEILQLAHTRSPHHDQICQRLADAYFRTGQLGAALTVLDELAGHYRNAGRLEPMAAVLRQMSQLAPNNIKVKSRLIDTYLQRGFVAEARAELIQRADLEERSGLIKDAIASLQRAADLSWTLGLAEESFSLYGRIIKLAPDVADYRHSLVTLYLQLGRLAEAAEQQRAIVDISLRQDRKHEAIAALHQVIGLTPDDTSAYYQLADLLSSIGEYGQAERVYKRIVAINPGDAIAQAKAMAMAALRERRGA